MIKNDRQYRITKAQLERFAQARNEAARNTDKNVHPRLLQAQAEAYASQEEDLRAQVAEYDALRLGHRAVIQAEGLSDLPRMFIQARIASGLSQKELATKLGLKEQQIQRYEATNYAGASLERLHEVAAELGLRVSQQIFLPEIKPSLSNLFARLGQVGLERSFICQRLLSREVGARVREAVPAEEDSRLAIQVAESVGRVFGLVPREIFSPAPLTLANVGGLLRFKMTANVDERRLGAYSLYASHLARTLLDAVPVVSSVHIPVDPAAMRRQIIKIYGELTFDAALRYAAGLGIWVLPLRDTGAFHGAYLRIGGRHVVILKQRTTSLSRWLFDLFHEIRHAGEQPEEAELSILETPETSAERRASPAEQTASRFAGEVLLNGRAEVLAKQCVRAADGAVERLKSVVPKVARSEGLATADLANYMAFRLSLQGINWWGTAHNLQPQTEDPWAIARDYLLEQIHFGALPEVDQRLLQLALSPEEIA